MFESLYQKSQTQSKESVFAHFNLKDAEGNFDPWFPFRAVAELAQSDSWRSYEKVNQKWKFPESNLEILASYLDHTFRRLQEEGNKILYSEDGQRACFNTGLLSKSFGDDIYLFFESNRNGSGCQPWYYKGAETQSSAVRRHLMEGFSGFPDVAEYYNAENYRDLFFDLEYDTITVPDHIVSDNIMRFPEQLRANSYAANLIVQGAIKSLYARLKRNYKLAVPHWYNGKIQLLLPLCLTDSRKPDLALLVERIDSQRCYLARTILTMPMAYQDARLISRVDAHWLTPTGA